MTNRQNGAKKVWSMFGAVTRYNIYNNTTTTPTNPNPSPILAAPAAATFGETTKLRGYSISVALPILSDSARSHPAPLTSGMPRKLNEICATHPPQAGYMGLQSPLGTIFSRYTSAASRLHEVTSRGNRQVVGFATVLRRSSVI